MSEKYAVRSFPKPGICLITLTRPEALNAIHTPLLQELRQTLTEEAENSKTRVVLLTGHGDKAFVAGADIAEMQSKNQEEAVFFAQLGHEVTKLLELMPKPTIAVVNGYALGGGSELALACDFILASENALFGQPEVGLGIIPGFGATLRLSRFVGLPRAKELIFSGRKFSARDAFEFGLVNHVYPKELLLEKAIELGTQITQQSFQAVSRAKKLLNEFTESMGLNFKLDAEAHAFGRLFETADQKEGMNAFMAKRSPVFE